MSQTVFIGHFIDNNGERHSVSRAFTHYNLKGDPVPSGLFYSTPIDTNESMSVFDKLPATYTPISLK